MNVGWDWDLHGPLALEALGETLYMAALTMLIGGAAGLIVGTALYVTRAGSILPNRVVFAVLNVVVNFVRPIPFVILLVAIIPLTSLLTGTFLGTAAVVPPLAIATAFGFSRIVEQNLVTIEPGVIEAARATGAGPWRIIATLLVPEALGPLILGVTFVFVAVIDMSAVAGTVGGGGLGDFALTYGHHRWNPVVTWAAVGVIIVLVQLVQLVGNRLSRAALRR
ncbi:D-methionine transport system permease protein [Diaminobutyricimonas aerilata]|uniref:D-methionine transport system permease protein n=1 Tax=Diaminobutyricimonas aerilata TaxID=1162967 RepID=A0A2M9CHN1_9MICO|nr:methionine ABC transporter permease [Diaminobutyricimonas aerilata]PJJ71423.1 D-methionine transport system permease protein [Diaminobutyricimonas aerilata]